MRFSQQPQIPLFFRWQLLKACSFRQNNFTSMGGRIFILRCILSERQYRHWKLDGIPFENYKSSFDVSSLNLKFSNYFTLKMKDPHCQQVLLVCFLIFLKFILSCRAHFLNNQSKAKIYYHTFYNTRNLKCTSTLYQKRSSETELNHA